MSQEKRKVTLKEYKLTRTIKGPKRKFNADGTEGYEMKEFMEGTMVYGQPERNNPEKLVVIQGGYKLPTDALQETGKTVEPVQSITSDVQKAIEKIKNQDLLKDITKKSKGALNGAVAGAVVGIIASWITKKPVFGFFLAGTVIGGVTGNILSKEPEAMKLAEVKPEEKTTYVAPGPKI